MPRENKKRGRRAEAQKRKRPEVDQTINSKRRRTSQDYEDDALESPSYEQFQDVEGPGQADDRPFYGLLNEDEQEYFKRADDMLEVNQFANPDERSLFIDNVHKEATGKELKLASSQSCSKLLERLILCSNPQQLKRIFQNFSGQFLHLSQHRFASHCCETLFIRAAPVVTQELLEDSDARTEDDDDETTTMQNMFLYTLDELEGKMDVLMTHPFASHTLRVLLIVLSGQALDSNSHRSLLRSKRQEKYEPSGLDKSRGLTLESRHVPDAFLSAVSKMTTDMLYGLDTHYTRALATHATGSPVLQLLLQLELTHFGKQRVKEPGSILHRLIPDDPLAEGTESFSFLNSLTFDKVGSRLLETIIQHSPARTFKPIYRQLFANSLGQYSRNDIASYVVCRVLERLSPEDLSRAMHAQIIPEIPILVERCRTNVIRTLIERCAVRNVDTMALAEALESAYSEDNGNTLSLSKMLGISKGEARFESVSTMTTSTPPYGEPEEEHSQHQSTESRKLSGQSQRPMSSENAEKTSQRPTPQVTLSSLLAQTMVSTPGPLSELILTALTALTSLQLLEIATTTPLSPLLQTALTSPTSSITIRRKLITRLYGHIASLSLNSSGSHVVDAVEIGTRTGLAFVRERVAEELAESESQLRESRTGRKVWRNWRMDLYCRWREEWVRDTRDRVGNDGFMSWPGGVGHGIGGGSGGTGTRKDGPTSTARKEEALASTEQADIKPKDKFIPHRPRGQANGGAPPPSRRKASAGGGGTMLPAGDSSNHHHQNAPPHPQNGKTPLELARERFAAKQARQAKHAKHAHDGRGQAKLAAGAPGQHHDGEDRDPGHSKRETGQRDGNDGAPGKLDKQYTTMPTPATAASTGTAMKPSATSTDGT
ncbi:MAG: Nucleolar protein 9 [Alyxoria varia]|nr:MAG: Nucleolar protein 9 [Alyxoria varia]